MRRRGITHGLVGGVNVRPEVASFTLVELLVVIAIIGVLAALLAPSLSAARKKAQQDLYVTEHRKRFANSADLNPVYGQYPVAANWTTGSDWGLLGSYHAKIVNALFADGHVEGLPENQMTGNPLLPPWSANDWIQALVK